MKLKVLKLIDQFGWAYHNVGKEQKAVSRHDIDYVRWQDFSVAQAAQYDVLYIPAPTIHLEVDQLIRAVRAGAPHVKIIGAYAGETATKYCDCDMVLAISLKQLPDLVNLYPDKAVIFLPEGIDTRFFTPPTCGCLPNFIAGYAGRVGNPKRVHLFSQLSHPVKMQTDHGAQFFVKDRSLEPMRDFYHSISCLVLASSSECMPRVVLEAMACGLPVVSTDVGSLSMLLPAFWRVPVNPEPVVVRKMDARLSLLAQDPEWCARIGARNRQLVEKRFSWDVLQPVWDRVFECAASGQLSEILMIGDQIVADLTPGAEQEDDKLKQVDKRQADVVLLLPEDTINNRRTTQQTIDTLHDISPDIEFNVTVLVKPKNEKLKQHYHPDRSPQLTPTTDMRYKGASVVRADNPFNLDREMHKVLKNCTSEYVLLQDYNTQFYDGWFEAAISDAQKPAVMKEEAANRDVVTIISANLGGIDKDACVHVDQDLPQGFRFDYKRFTDDNMPPRPLALTARMQSKLPKMLGFEYAPQSKFYIWLDSAYVIKSPNFVTWMLNKLGDGDICLMPHESRHSIAEELQFITEHMPDRNAYLRSRYEGEPMAEQVASYLSDPTFKDDQLAVAGCFIYRNTPAVQAMLRDWLLECYKWTYQDQFSLMYMLHKHNIKPRWLDATVWDCPYLHYAQHKGAPAAVRRIQ